MNRPGTVNAVGEIKSQTLSETFMTGPSSLGVTILQLDPTEVPQRCAVARLQREVHSAHATAHARTHGQDGDGRDAVWVDHWAVDPAAIRRLLELLLGVP